MLCKNKLFVANKPQNISSNHFLSRIKRKYKTKKAGFSGTLDPFANGVLIMAFGQHTKLFRFLKKSPKTYIATLWIGAYSKTLDSEGIEKADILKPFAKESIDIILSSLKGELEYYPPKFSAKKVEGQRAYRLARANKKVNLKKIKSTIYDIKMLHYRHPFLTFEITISEGGYVRSIGEHIANKLGFNGALTYLQRVCEGDFIYEREKSLNPIHYLDIEENCYINDKNNILLGKKLKVGDFKIQANGQYFINLDKMLSIIEIKDDKVSYILNGIVLC